MYLSVPTASPGRNPIAMRAGMPWARAIMIIAVANWTQ
jgi:hypothetical protein